MISSKKMTKEPYQNFSSVRPVGVAVLTLDSNPVKKPLGAKLQA